MKHDYTIIRRYSNEIYHHGILGMHWGKKNGPPYPLGASDHSVSEKKAGWRDSLRKKSKNSSKGKLGSKSKNEANKKKSKLTPQQKTYIRNAAIGAAIGLGIGVGCYIYLKKKGGSFELTKVSEDITLDADTIFQRISPAEERDLHEVFYAAFDPHDKERYEGLLQQHYKQRGYDDVVKKLITGTSGDKIKIAGHDTAERIFEEVLNPIEKANFFNNYDTFNQYAVMNRDERVKDIYKKFFDKLKEEGYSGFIDINDQNYSGYNAKCPLVLFNDAKQFSVSKVTGVDAGKVAIENNKMVQEMFQKGYNDNAYQLKEVWKEVDTSGVITNSMLLTTLASIGLTRLDKKETKKEEKKIKKIS